MVFIVANKAKVKEAHAALKRLEREVDNGGFNEYAQHCEELLIEVLPYLSDKGLEMVKRKSLENCRLEVSE